MNNNIRLHADPDREADTLTAYILDANPDTRPTITTCQQAGDLPYVLKSLLRRAQVMERLWDRLIAESLVAKTTKERGELGRQAHALNKELTSVLGAIYKIGRDQALDGLRPSELLLADSSPPTGLPTLERVQAELVADAVFDAEFKEMVQRQEARLQAGPSTTASPNGGQATETEIAAAPCNRPTADRHLSAAPDTAPDTAAATAPPVASEDAA